MDMLGVSLDGGFESIMQDAVIGDEDEFVLHALSMDQSRARTKRL